jgi:hypothetical protein
MTWVQAKSTYAMLSQKETSFVLLISTPSNLQLTEKYKGLFIHIESVAIT